MIKSKKIGLALSGGGYRAAAFHLGTLRCLNKLGLLEKIDVISTISGGSIAGAFFSLHTANFEDFEKKFKECLSKSVIVKILTSIRFIFSVLIILLLIGAGFYLLDSFFAAALAMIAVIIVCTLLLFKIFPFTVLKERAYKKIFFKESKLSDLTNHPTLAINCTNLETGRIATFSRDKFSDSFYEYNKGIKFNAENIPVSFAVACSTAVPVPFHPMTIPKEYFVDEKQFSLIKPALVDGGVYDNQGIHKLTEKSSSYKCDVIICSDGSFPYKRIYLGSNPYSLLKRVVGTLMARIKHFQFASNIYTRSDEDIKEIAYFSLDWNYESVIAGFVSAVKSKSIRIGVLESHNITSFSNDEELGKMIKDKIHYQNIIKNGLSGDEIKQISKISTNLHTLKENQIKLLSTHAEVLTELHIRLYCPSLFEL